jgi:hypothetical protein
MPCSALWAAIMAVLERDVPKRSAALPGKEAMRAVGLADQNFAAASPVTLLKAMSLRYEGTQHRHRGGVLLLECGQ